MLLLCSQHDPPGLQREYKTLELHPCRSYLRRRNPAENGLRLPCHSPTPCPRHSVWRGSRHGRVPALGVQIRERPEAILAAELVGLAIYIQLWSRCFAPSYWL